MKNKVCEILNIKYPIFQGSMQWVSNASLVAAVSEAGGMGVLSVSEHSNDQIRDEIRKIREKTDKPFAVNTIQQYKKRDEVAKILLEENVKYIVSSAGNPEPFMKDWLDAGITVIGVVASIKHAKKMEELGASIIVAEGHEAGGHIGQMTTMALVPQICDAVNIPVVAAGGIADGRGMAAAFALGAQGVQMGTAFLVAKECEIHPNFKRMVIESQPKDIACTGRLSDSPVHCIRNDLAIGFERLDRDRATAQEYADWGTGATRLASVDGDVKKGSFMAGQIVGLVKEERSASDIIQSTIRQYEEALQKMPQGFRD